MVWKEGKLGHHTGKTVRSNYAKQSTPRRDGVVLVRNGKGSFRDQMQVDNPTEDVIYSLGKQNRWLLPDLMKDSGDLQLFGAEEVRFLVERKLESTQRQRKRGNCLSVFDSNQGRVRRAKGKYALAETLTNGELRSNVAIEFAYPYCKGSWPLNQQPNKKSRQKSGSKRRNRTRTVDQIEEFYDEEEDFIDFHDREEDELEFESDDASTYIENQHAYSLADFLSNSSKAIGYLPEKSIKTKHPFTNKKQRCVYLDNEDEAMQHDNFIPLEERKIANQGNTLLTEFFYTQANATKDPKHNIEKKVSATFSIEGKETEPSSLERTFGTFYREGESFPRKFAVSVLDELFLYGIQSADILFELSHSDECRLYDVWSVSLVVCSEVSEFPGSQDMEQILSEVVSRFAGCLDGFSYSVGEVVLAAVKCIEEHIKNAGIEKCVDSSNPRRPLYSMHILERATGYKSKTCTEDQSKHDVRRRIQEKCTSTQLVFSVQEHQTLFCDICFEEVSKEAQTLSTTMKACLHSFCNLCWEEYLKTEISNGQTDLTCPSSQCSTSLDEITIMALIPSGYSKYLLHKIRQNLNRSPEWLRCPSDKCRFINRITCTERGKSTNVDYTDSPAPILCGCGEIWCWSCRQTAHWPASCQEASKVHAHIRKAASMYLAPVEIKYVMVKNCPMCHYPIEKYFGCSNMHCILCGTNFCWNCLKLSHNTACEPNAIMHKKVYLPKHQRELSLLDIAVKNFSARKSGVLFRERKRLSSIQKGLNSYFALRLQGLFVYTDVSKLSRAAASLQTMTEISIHRVLKQVYDVKIQAHIVLEGAAIILMSNKQEKKLKQDFYRLVFIMDQVTMIIKEERRAAARFKAAKLERLQGLVHFAEKCILDISRHVMEMKSK